MNEIIEIAAGGYSAKINLSRGANCISLRNSEYGAVILREPKDPQEPDSLYLYGMPILFPVNRISGGSFEFEGRLYEFPINEPKIGNHLHGTLNHIPFALVSKTKSKVVCSYKATETAPYLAFPHAFEITIEYLLKEDGLYQTVIITNDSDENMPNLIGFHTTFNADFLMKGRKRGIRIYADISEEYERNMTNYLPNGNKPCFDEVGRALSSGKWNPFLKKVSKHYRAGARGEMIIRDEDNDLCVVYENDAKYGFRLVYNGDADEYVCLEPQNALANSPNSPFSRDEAGFDYIEPHNAKVYISKIYLAEGTIAANTPGG